MKSIGEKVVEKGAVLFGTLTSDIFVKSSKQLTQTVHEVPDEIFEANYRKFLEVLENHLKTKTKSKYESKELIQDFLNSELKLYKGVEITIQSICAAAVKISVESDVESLVSRYEKHLKIDRQMKEENAEEEMEIAENGPLLIHADRILKRAMDNYWKDVNQIGEWHFVQKKSARLLFKS